MPDDGKPLRDRIFNSIMIELLLLFAYTHGQHLFLLGHIDVVMTYSSHYMHIICLSCRCTYVQFFTVTYIILIVQSTMYV